jgi:choline dehydrogenase-like flavoprotein
MERGYDYIIAGGGSAGCTLAARLSEDRDVRVLLIEAGGSDWHPLFHMPAGFAKMTKGIASWGYETVPQKHMNDRVFRYTQAKIIGGGSTINAQNYVRGNALDFDEWAQAGCAGWSYREVLPYFKRTEGNARFRDSFHGGDGPLGVGDPVAPLPICKAFFEAAKQAGIPFNPDFNGARQDGVGHYQLTQKHARRSSTATALLRPALKRPNLTLMRDAYITRIVIAKGRATGVEVAGKSGVSVVSAKREIVLAAGAIGTPRLLMLSGIGPADHLKKAGVTPLHDLPGVGTNLQDHVDICVICECTGDHTYDKYAKPHWAALAGLRYLVRRDGPVASSLFETGGFWFADGNARSPDTQFHLGLGSGIEAGIAKLKNAGVTLNSAFLRPRSRGTVRLRSADPADGPLIDPNYWSDSYDKEMSIRGFKLAREIMQQDAFKPFVLAERVPGPQVASDEAIAAYAAAAAKTDHHPVGTCKMGRGSDAVVDPELRLRGIEALRVADASIMPYIVSGNTNAAAIMIAEKAADLIAGRPPLAPVSLAA